MAKIHYRVIAPVVLAKTMTTEGVRWIQIQTGGVVPDDVEQSWIDGHLGIGYIAPIDAPEDKPAPEPVPEQEAAKEPGPKPAAPPRGRRTEEG